MGSHVELAVGPLRAPRAFHLASTLTWAMAGLPAMLQLAARPGALAEPIWAIRAALFLAWPAAGFAAGAGEIRWNVPRRVAALAVQSAAALGLLATAPSSPAIMLLFPVAGTAPFLLPPRRAITLVALQTAVLMAIYASAMAPVPALVAAFCTIGGEIFGLGAGHLAVTERRARQELARVHAALQATQALLAESVRETERVRISRDLHDTLGHHLAALSVHLEVAAHLSEGKLAEHVGQARSVAKRLLSEVREVVGTLHDDGAIDLGAALATLVAGVPEPVVHLTLPPDLRVSDPGLAHAVFRCVQEIVTNAVRHAHARNLWIDIRHGPGGLAVEARDDGHGAPDYTPGRGLRGMGERLEELGGRLVVASHPGRGFEVRATLPVPHGLA
jgi:signal transduction histidine kinase